MTRLRRGLDLALDSFLVLVAWWTVLYWIGLATQWSLWPFGWLWLAASPVLVWLTVRSAPDDDGSAPEPEEDESRPDRTAPLLLGAIGFAALVAVASLLGWSDRFKVVWLLSMVGIVVATAGRFLALRRPTGPVAPVGRFSDLAALALAVGVGAFSLFLHLPDLDDPFYVNRSVWIAEHGNASTLDTMFSPELFPTAYNGGLPIGSWEGLLGVLAKMSGLSVGTLTWLVVTGLASAATVWALYRLARSWAPALPLLVVVVAVGYLLMSGDSRLGNFWIARMWQGKVVAVTILLPLVWVYVGQVLESRSRRPLVLLAVAGVAFVGLTSTAVILAPIMAGAVFLAALLFRDVRLGLGAVLYGLGPVLSGAAVLLFSDSAVGGEEPNLLSAKESFVRVLGPNPTMVALALGAVVLGAVLVRTGRHGVVLGVTAVVCLGIFLPGVLPLINDTTGAGPILWRFLYCLPIPLLVGLLVVAPVPLVQRYLGDRPAAVAPYGVAAVLLAGVAVVGAPLWTTVDHNGPVTLESKPVWKVDLEALEDVEAVMATDPTGVILMPTVQMRTLPMYTTQAFSVVPRVWYADILEQSPEDRADRFALMDLANGARPFLTQERITAALANLDVTVACIGRTRTQQAVALLEGAGYVDPTRRGRMTCLTRGSS
ncbi:MAG TPA: DUF6077 domain-containing protein [Nocardioidaceae bacterium]|nr:DUF6077 domain-containing protein [Nocardioidaceae bacterium]